MIDACNELNVAEEINERERESKKKKKKIIGYFSKSYLWINSFDWIKSVVKCEVDIDFEIDWKKRRLNLPFHLRSIQF